MVERPGVQDLLDHHVLLVIPMAPQEDTHEDDLPARQLAQALMAWADWLEGELAKDREKETT